MVRGLEIFKEYFASYLDQYVLIRRHVLQRSPSGSS